MNPLSVFTTSRAHSGLCIYLQDHLNRVLAHAEILHFSKQEPLVLQKALEEKAKSIGTGLIRLSIEKDNWSIESRSLQKLTQKVYEKGAYTSSSAGTWASTNEW